MPKPQHEYPLYLFDSQTAEILKPDDLLRDHEHLPDEELVELIAAAGELLKDLGRAVSLLQSTMIHRMEADQATLRETPGYTVKLVPQRAYEYDTERLLTLKAHLPPEQFERAIKTEIKPNKAELNKLQRLGGPVKAIIEASVRPVPKPPRLEIIPKPAVPA